MSNNFFFEWRKTEEKNGNTKEHYLNIPVKVVKAVDDGFGFKGNLVCNQCNSKVDQLYICQNCGDKNSIGGIKKRKTKTFRDGKEIDVIYEEIQKKTFMENEKSKTIRVVEEIDAQKLLKEALRIVEHYEMYNNDKEVSPTILKVHGYLDRNSKALVVDYCGEGGVLIAGKGELTLFQLRDSRLIRRPKQENIPCQLDDAVAETLNNVSEDNTPEKMEKFIEMVYKGEKIETPLMTEKPKIVVENSWLEG